MKQFNLAMVGLHFGRYLIDTELAQGCGAPYFRIHTVCDTNLRLAQECAEAYGAKCAVSIDTILCDAEVDLVVLITGPNGRAKLLDRILDAGKPVITTKPFETNAQEAIRILEKAKRLGVPLFINSPQPVPQPELASILHWQQAYNLGRLIGYQGNVWAGYREQPDGTWYDDPALCPVAPLLRLGIYCLNDLSWFTPEEICEVHVQQSRIFTQRPTADSAQISISHPDGTLGHIFASFCVDDGAPYQDAFALQFERGSVTRRYLSRNKKQGETISITLTAQYDNTDIAESKTFSRLGAGYCWDIMHAVLCGAPLPQTIRVATQQVAKVVRVVEHLRKAGEGQTALSEI